VPTTSVLPSRIGFAGAGLNRPNRIAPEAGPATELVVFLDENLGDTAVNALRIARVPLRRLREEFDRARGSV
jgi:hypothetical protein